MSELIAAFEAEPTRPAAIDALERALFATGPLLYLGNVYAIADERPVASLEVHRAVRRAELVPIP